MAANSAEILCHESRQTVLPNLGVAVTCALHSLYGSAQSPNAGIVHAKKPKGLRGRIPVRPNVQKFDLCSYFSEYGFQIQTR